MAGIADTRLSVFVDDMPTRVLSHRFRQPVLLTLSLSSVILSLAMLPW